MSYYDITTTVHIGQSTKKPRDVAEQEYEKRLSWPSTFSSRIILDGKHEVFVVATRRLVKLLDAIEVCEMRIRELWHMLPGIAGSAYLVDLLIDEMLATTQMEGVRSTKREMSEALAAVAEGKRNKRFAEFVRLYVSFSNGRDTEKYPQSLQELRSIYERIVDGELDKSDEVDGELFRKHPVYVSDPARGPVHDGLMPESAIQVALTQMLSFARSSDMPAMLTAVICHYVFEYVHPFYDGNGRTGRFLLSVQLDECLCVPTVLSISAVIAENKGKYDKAFEQAEKASSCSELTFFAETMLGFICDAQHALLGDLQMKKKSLDTARQRLHEYEESHHGMDGHAGNVMFYLIQHDLFGKGSSDLSRKRISELEHIGYASARTVLDGLVDKGLVRARGKRPIYYALSEQGRALFIAD